MNPDEDEEYELLLEQEMEMLRESGQIATKQPTQIQFLTEEEELQIFEAGNFEQINELQTSELNTQEKNLNQTHDTTNVSTTSHFGGLSCVSGGTVNRRLFPTAYADRITSTPVVVAKCSVQGDKEAAKQKRRFDRDLFGVDLYENESYTDPVVKKMRVEEEQDLETIEKILSIRQSVAVSSTKTCNRNILYLKNLHDFKRKNLSYTVPQWPFLPIRRSDQNKLFVRFHSTDYENRVIQDICARSSNEILGENKQNLWNEANNIILERMQQQTSISGQNNETQKVQECEENLWVEKYKPRKYLDLLSAEMTNRSLLLWLKMWDKVVFGREFTPKSNLTEVTQKLNTFNKRTGKFESNGGWPQRRPRPSTNLDMNCDEYGRPVQKVALLHGAPGLGKTTLAHILSRHAGYQSIEINASDDRSPTYFQQALENGTQMSSLLNEDRRPNCIILDEIDGAPRQSIEFLVKFVSDSFQNKRVKGTGKTKKNVLKRPIICICNDIYESALRPLRQIAFIVQFPPIEVSRLEERLKHIAKLERLKTDASALYALAQKTGNDVRSCISTLQFFKAENKAITLHDVLNSSISRKDVHQGFFAVWTAVFQIQRNTDHHSNKTSEVSQQNENPRVRKVLDSVQASGDYQRLMNGVYENFLNQKMPDSNFGGIYEALQWFCFSDSIQHKINHQQNYSIYPYLQFGFAKWHLLFSSLSWPKINFPTRGIEFSQKSATQRSIYDSLRKAFLSSSGVGSLGLSGKSILLEAVPYLKKIISPTLRNLPVELFSVRERQDFKHTIEVMADLGLTYIQVKSLEGAYQFQMEPDLEALVKFTGFPGVSLSYFGRQMIAREVEIERIHRAAPKLTGTFSENAVSKNSKSEEKKIPNHLRKLQPKIPVELERPKFPGNAISKYFGNNLFQSSKQMVTSGSTAKHEDPIVKSPIWYHYKEGFNNAVRKDVHMKELL